MLNTEMKIMHKRIKSKNLPIKRVMKKITMDSNTKNLHILRSIDPLIFKILMLKSSRSHAEEVVGEATSLLIPTVLPSSNPNPSQTSSFYPQWIVVAPIPSILNKPIMESSITQ